MGGYLFRHPFYWQEQPGDWTAKKNVEFEFKDRRNEKVMEQAYQKLANFVTWRFERSGWESSEKEPAAPLGRIVQSDRGRY